MCKRPHDDEILPVRACDRDDSVDPRFTTFSTVEAKPSCTDPAVDDDKSVQA